MLGRSLDIAEKAVLAQGPPELLRRKFGLRAEKQPFVLDRGVLHPG